MIEFVLMAIGAFVVIAGIFIAGIVAGFREIAKDAPKQYVEWLEIREARRGKQ